MGYLRLIHWNASEAAERAARLRQLGYDVACDLPAFRDLLRQMRDTPPLAVVIDLGRLPSQGRDVAVNIRHTKATRALPIVFVGGEAEKVARVQAALPDAVYTSWDTIAADLAHAIANPPETPSAPKSVFDVYQGEPLLKKLGIQADTRLSLVDAPPDILTMLEPLPDGVQVRDTADGPCDLMLWFVRTQADLDRAIDTMAGRDDFGSLWIVWPKKSSGVDTEVTQPIARKTGLAAGLVDYKVCAIDATWTGLRFTRRKR